MLDHLVDHLLDPEQHLLDHQKMACYLSRLHPFV